MSDIAKILIALIAFALLAWSCVSHSASRIESNIRANVAAEIAADLGDTVTLEVSGRDVMLSGVASDAIATRMIGTAKATPGVRRVVNRLEMASAVARISYKTEVRLEEAGLVVAGELPSGDSNTALLNSLTRNGQILNQTSVRDNPPAGWSTALSTGITALGELDSGALQVEDDRLMVSGVAASDVQRSAALAALGGLGDRVTAVNISTRQPTAAVVAEQVQSCQSRFDERLSGEKILFATSSSEIDVASQALLSELGLIARDCPNVSVEIAGHTDSRGDATLNRSLSIARANAVRDALIALGIDEGRLASVGYGEDWPRSDNATAEGREDNRRIELTVRARDTTASP